MALAVVASWFAKALVLKLAAALDMVLSTEQADYAAMTIVTALLTGALGLRVKDATGGTGRGRPRTPGLSVLLALLMLALGGCAHAPWPEDRCKLVERPDGSVRMRCSCKVHRFHGYDHPNGKPKPARHIVTECDGKTLPYEVIADDGGMP